MKRIAIGLAVLSLSAIGLVGVASPAAAHHNTVSGQAVCQSDGTYTINWTVQNSESDKTETATLKTSTGGGTLTGLPANIGNGGSAAVTQTGVVLSTTATLQVHGVWSNGNTNDSNVGSVTTGSDCKVVVTPVAPTVVQSTQCEVNGSVTPAVTRGVVYTVGGTSPTAITVTATPAQGFRFAGESQQVVYGPYDVSSETCPTPTPTPEPTPPPQPEPPKDFCPDLAGVQWENYDCNPVVATPAPTPTPTVEPTPVPTPEPTVEPTPTEPPVVVVPDEPTIPQAVPAGDGSSQDSGYPWFAVLIGAIVGCFAGAIIAAYNLRNK